MDTGVGHFFRTRALLFSSVDGNELEALAKDLDSSWTGAISWTIGLVSQLFLDISTRRRQELRFRYQWLWCSCCRHWFPLFCRQRRRPR